MKAVILREFGGPEKLVIEAIPKAQPGPDQVRLRVHSIGLNRADVAMRVGKYPLPKELPIRLGFEGAGLIDAIGANVTQFKIGDRASVLPIGGLFAEQGSYAEYVTLPVDALVHTPLNLSDDESAATWMAYMTCWTSLIRLARLTKGEAVVITAASSSLGVPAVQVARREGAASIVITRTAAKVALLREHGADFVIDSSRDNVAERILEFTNGHGANVAFDCVGGPQVKELIRAMASGGRMVLYGMLDSRPVEFVPMAIMRKELTLFGHMVFHLTEDLSVRRESARYICEGISAGAFRPIVSRVFPFAQVATAHAYMQSNEQFGKIVLKT